MKLSVKVQKRQFDAKMRELGRQWSSQGPRGAAELGRVFVRAVEILARRDTNRYVAGWQRANNSACLAAGATDLRLAESPIQKSKYVAGYISVLADQHDKLVAAWKHKNERLNRWYDAKGRAPDKFYRDEKRKLERMGKRIDITSREIDRFAESDGTALVMSPVNWNNTRADWEGGTARSGIDHSKDTLLKSRLATVRRKVYGGSGRIFGAGPQWFVTLRNQEPHCRVIEWRYRTVAKARAGIKSIGIQSVGRAAVQRITAAVSAIRAAG